MRRVAVQPGAHRSGILAAAVVETAIEILAARRVRFGLGVTQQEQATHDAVSIRARGRRGAGAGGLIDKGGEDKVTSTERGRRKRHG